MKLGIQKQSALNETLSTLLPLWVRWVYLATNVPFLILSWQIMQDGIGGEPRFFYACNSRLFTAGITLTAGVASILFHGTQCRCFTIGPENLYAVPGAGWALKRATSRMDPALLEPSIFMNVIDIICALSLGLFLFGCNGGLRAADWATYGIPTLGLLVVSALLKRAKRYIAYTCVHSVWHLAGAHVATKVVRGELL